MNNTVSTEWLVKALVVLFLIGTGFAVFSLAGFGSDEETITVVQSGNGVASYDSSNSVIQQHQRDNQLKPDYITTGTTENEIEDAVPLDAQDQTKRTVQSDHMSGDKMMEDPEGKAKMADPEAAVNVYLAAEKPMSPQSITPNGTEATVTRQIIRPEELMADGTHRAASNLLLVLVDRAQIVRLSQPAGSLIIGNPLIADAAIHDRQTLIITGKTYGTTNLIVLNRRGDIILDRDVQVRAGGRAHLTIHRGMGRESYACVPVCERVLAVGDNQASFEGLKSTIEGRIEAVTGQAGTAQ